MIEDGLLEILAAEYPMTVRQVFYRAISAGLVPKTEAAYKTTVGRLLVRLRREGRLPYSWLADSTRWQRKPRSFNSLDDALENTKRTYRRALWNDQEAHVEIWIEKDAIAGVVYDITAEWDVPLMAVRGYPSLSFLHSAAEDIAGVPKPTFIYYLGDHDPSGVHIPKKIEADLHEMAPRADITFERVAVSVEQIAEFNLATRPTKTTDSRSKSFVGESVEVDAIPPANLRAIVRDCIERHVDRGLLERTRLVEEAERETLANMIRGAA